ncbi:LCP family protein [Candidatus Saccharibacteria bacterium]|nr:LCP family protein [Candidatus Saccharibacteria bacterium]
MKENKSIDGLSTRGAKKPAPAVVKRKTGSAKHPAKKLTITAPTETPVSMSDTVEDISIDIIEESSTTTPTSKPVSFTPKPAKPAKSATMAPTTSVEDFLKPVQAFDFSSETGELTASTDISTPVKSDTATTKESKRMKKDKKKPGKARRIITSILLLIVLALIGVILWAVLWGNDIIAKITGGQGNVLDLITLTNETYEPLKTDSNGRTNILAFGTSGFDMAGTDGDGTHDGAQLTDSIMMISLNQNTGDIAMLSLPRDLKVPGACYAGKVNEVYFCNNDNGNDEAAGASALMSEIGAVLGIDFQYYAHLNWGSLVSIVDTLGGIKVTLDEDIADYGWTDAVYEAGVEYTINGEEALGLARARHGTMGGDFTRGTSQQKILIGIKNRVFEKNLSIPDLLSLASTLGDNLRTNFTLSELKTLAHLTYEFDFDSMRQIMLIDYINGIYYMTTGTINGISYVIPAAGEGNYGEIQAYVAEQLSNDPRVYEAPTILVLNATDTAGLAGTERTKLLAEGYQDITADNAPEGTYPTGITIYAITDNKLGTKSLLTEYYSKDFSDPSSLPDSIPRTYDFIIILNPAEETKETDN